MLPDIFQNLVKEEEAAENKGGDLKSTDARDWKLLLQPLTTDLESSSRLVVDGMQNSLVVLGITSAKAQI